jgi:hypothetical protein
LSLKILVLPILLGGARIFFCLSLDDMEVVFQPPFREETVHEVDLDEDTFEKAVPEVEQGNIHRIRIKVNTDRYQCTIYYEPVSVDSWLATKRVCGIPKLIISLDHDELTKEAMITFLG